VLLDIGLLDALGAGDAEQRVRPDSFEVITDIAAA
jgi:hypothetical protein